MRKLLAWGLLTVPAMLPAEEVTCASAHSMDGLMARWTVGFNASHPTTPARIVRRAQFSADFVEPLARGDVVVASFARELFASERAAFVARAGGEPHLVPVATGSRATKGGTHAIVFFVNAHNPITHLAMTQLREIWKSEGTLTTWGQLGLTGEWTHRRISLHGMRPRRDTGNPPGIVNFLESRLLAGDGWSRDLHSYVDVPGGEQSLEQIVRAVAADEGAIGYSGFAYAVPGVKALALGETESGPFFAGSAGEIASRRYPLARTLYLCTGPSPDAAAREFIAYVLSPAGQRAITGDDQKFFSYNATSTLHLPDHPDSPP
ncbi:MAG: substrate-binding domain-containing protein [Opitutaceae bacterium]